MNSFASGFALGFSLILAIGSQNAFILRAGLARRFVLPLVLTCAISDAVLITLGVAGLGKLVQTYPAAILALRYFGAAFLTAYGLRALWSAATADQGLVAQGSLGSLRQAILTCLLFTWLNPHVYLDTVVLLGAIAQQNPHPFEFGFGAVVASFVFFFSLGYGAGFLTPIFANPRSWRILDSVIALTMFTLAAMLLTGT